MVVENRGDGHPKDTHDGDVVDRHAHVLGVVQGRDLDTHGQNRFWYISAGNELKFWLLV